MASPPSLDTAKVLRGAWAEIHLDAVRDNVRALRRALAQGVRFMAVVKADAYGHGAVHTSRAAVDAGAWSLGVATIEEGLELRRAGLEVPILVLGAIPPEGAEAAVAHGLDVAVFTVETGRALSRAAVSTGRNARMHLKVDTGLGRIGVAPHDAAALARALSALPGAVLEGCFTHFATAHEADLGPARAQLETFRAVLASLDAAGIAVRVRHAANTAGMLALPEAQFDLVRCGIGVYGIPPAPHLADRAGLRPVMRLYARIAHTRRVEAGTPIGYGRAYRAVLPSTIVTIPVGYADGYPRLVEQGGCVVRHGRRLPIAGRISMDMLMVDAGTLPVHVGDTVELWGEALPVGEIAAAARTIPHEVLARVSGRVPRVYMQDGRVVAVRTLLGEEA
jgi:alanine racemase